MLLFWLSVPLIFSTGFLFGVWLGGRRARLELESVLSHLRWTSSVRELIERDPPNPS